MIDWLTLSFPTEYIHPDDREKIISQLPYIEGYDRFHQPTWRSYDRQTLRSDERQLQYKFSGAALTIYGSPARTVQSHNIFGSSDIGLCAINMIDMASRTLNVNLDTNLFNWFCTRIDYNNNYLFFEQKPLLQCLDVLSKAQVPCKKNISGTTVSFGSRRSNIFQKFYDKGSHIEMLLRKKEIFLTMREQELSKFLLRNEITLNSKEIKSYNIHWSYITEEQLQTELQKRTDKLIGKAIMKNEKKDYLQMCIDVSTSVQSGTNLYNKFNTIQKIGLGKYRTLVCDSTYFSTRKKLLEAGISIVEMSASNNIVQYKKQNIELGQRVVSFNQIEQITEQQLYN